MKKSRFICRINVRIRILLTLAISLCNANCAVGIALYPHQLKETTQNKKWLTNSNIAYKHKRKIEPKLFNKAPDILDVRDILSFLSSADLGSAVAWCIMPRTPDPEVGGSSPTRVKPCCVFEKGTFTPQKVLVIPRKRWLCPNLTEKLFTGTLRINQPTNQPSFAN